MTTISHQHPKWCDPRLCATDSGGIDHRSEPTVWTACDHELSVSRSRYDEVLASGEVLHGADRIRLTVEDQACVNGAGEVVAVEVDLALSEARLLTEALAPVIEQVAADLRITR